MLTNEQEIKIRFEYIAVNSRDLCENSKFMRPEDVAANAQLVYDNFFSNESGGLNMIYFVKGEYKVYTIISGCQTRPELMKFEIIIDFDLMKLYDAIRREFETDNIKVSDIKRLTILLN